MYWASANTTFAGRLRQKLKKACWKTATGCEAADSTPRHLYSAAACTKNLSKLDICTVLQPIPPNTTVMEMTAHFGNFRHVAALGCSNWLKPDFGCLLRMLIAFDPYCKDSSESHTKRLENPATTTKYRGEWISEFLAHESSKSRP